MAYPMKISKIILLVFLVACAASTVLADENIELVIRSDGEDIPIAVGQASSSPLKIYKNGTVYGIQLVDVGDPSATKMRINLPGVGIKAFKRFAKQFIWNFYANDYTRMCGSCPCQIQCVDACGSCRVIQPCFWRKAELKQIGFYYYQGATLIRLPPFVEGTNIGRGGGPEAGVGTIPAIAPAGIYTYWCWQAAGRCNFYIYSDNRLNSWGNMLSCTHGPKRTDYYIEDGWSADHDDGRIVIQMP